MKFWQVDAFTQEIFCGNPAGVFIFETEPDERLMQKIARELNLSDTAFVITFPQLKIRWFTPKSEVNLCGHATLSAAHVMWEQRLSRSEEIDFQSRSGPLKVRKEKDGYSLDLPAQPAMDKPDYKKSIAELLGLEPVYVGSNGEDCMAVVDDEEFVQTYVPDHTLIAQLEERGLLLTTQDREEKYDYIYRGFFPKLGVPEDPVTGSANTCLAPYWSKRLQKTRLHARQISERSGDLILEVTSNRVLITGDAVTVFEGEMRCM